MLIVCSLAVSTNFLATFKTGTRSTARSIGPGALASGCRGCASGPLRLRIPAWITLDVVWIVLDILDRIVTLALRREGVTPD